jgi:hypothetical protein
VGQFLIMRRAKTYQRGLTIGSEPPTMRSGLCLLLPTTPFVDREGDMSGYPTYTFKLTRN